MKDKIGIEDNIEHYPEVLFVSRLHRRNPWTTFNLPSSLPVGLVARRCKTTVSLETNPSVSNDLLPHL